MRRTKAVVRKATQDDVALFAPDQPRPSLRGLCIEKDGEIIALGGVARVRGRWLAFADIRPEAREAHKMMVMRGAKRIFNEIRREGFKTVYAYPDDREPTSRRWMKSLGFKRMKGGFYKWQP